VLWFTGLSGAGKTTIAKAFVRAVRAKTKLIDSDEITYIVEQRGRFTEADRIKNQKDILDEVARFYNRGYFVLASFITPFRRDREFARSFFPDNFFEIFIDSPLELCKRRDPKQLYEKFSRGEIENFVGCNVEYELPDHPDLTIRTETAGVEDAVTAVVDFLRARDIPVEKLK